MSHPETTGHEPGGPLQTVKLPLHGPVVWKRHRTLKISSELGLHWSSFVVSWDPLSSWVSLTELL